MKFLLQFCCMNLIADTRAEGGLVFYKNKVYKNIEPKIQVTFWPILCNNTLKLEQNNPWHHGLNVWTAGSRGAFQSVRREDGRINRGHDGSKIQEVHLQLWTKCLVRKIFLAGNPTFLGKDCKTFFKRIKIFFIQPSCSYRWVMIGLHFQ